LGQFNSRLRHAEEDEATGLRGVRQRFSTPTIPNYGVSKHYELSDKKTYHVKCKKCNTWQIPSYYADYVIPGYDGEIALFEASDLYNEKHKINEAYVKCQSCGSDLWTSLIDPERRQWVAERPEVINLSGYQISPIDVPHYNKVPAIFDQLKDYTLQDHRNFVVGLPHEDKNNSFLMSIFSVADRCDFIELQLAKSLTLRGLRFGLDVGKTSYLAIVQKKTAKEYRVMGLFTFTATPGNTIAKQVQPYMDAFKPEMTVVDAAPDFSTSQTLIGDNTYATVFGCEYRRSISETFSHIEIRDEDGIIRADRSGTLSHLMEVHNKGYITYPNSPETEVIKSHLEVTKKVVRKGDMGDVVMFPKPSQPDHYAHALNYALIADIAVDKEDYLGGAVGVLPGIKAVTVGENVKPTPTKR